MSIETAQIEGHRAVLRGDALVDPGALAPGLDIVVSDLLPMPPSPGEEARRIVRHGFAAARRITGRAALFPDAAGAVGPLPGDQTHAFVGQGKAFLSKQVWERLYNDRVESVHTGVRRGV